jgi:hypothetical protein
MSPQGRLLTLRPFSRHDGFDDSLVARRMSIDGSFQKEMSYLWFLHGVKVWWHLLK